MIVISFPPVEENKSMGIVSWIDVVRREQCTQAVRTSSIGMLPTPSAFLPTASLA